MADSKSLMESVMSTGFRHGLDAAADFAVRERDANGLTRLHRGPGANDTRARVVPAYGVAAAEHRERAQRVEPSPQLAQPGLRGIVPRADAMAQPIVGPLHAADERRQKLAGIPALEPPAQAVKAVPLAVSRRTDRGAHSKCQLLDVAIAQRDAHRPVLQPERQPSRRLAAALGCTRERLAEPLVRAA